MKGETELRVILYILTAYFGLWLYLLLASALRWIEPIWWGGKALFLPIIGTIYVPVSALISYAANILIQTFCCAEDILYWRNVIGGTIIGFIFFPCLEITIYIKSFVPGWEKLDPYLAINIGFVINSTLTAVIGTIALHFGKLFSSRSPQ